MKTQVVNLSRAKGEFVRIDRMTEYGNPYTHLPVGRTSAVYAVETREESIECYKQWILKEEKRLKRVLALKGKVLACHCKPKACHGDVIAMLADNGVVDVGGAKLSNFEDAVVSVAFGDKVHTAPSVEHAYQASKASLYDDFAFVLRQSTPGQANRAGSRIQMAPWFEKEKVQVMKELLMKKFQLPEHRERLLATGSAYIVEYTMWHDNFWGTCRCAACKEKLGKNVLGELLMEVRSSLQPKASQDKPSQLEFFDNWDMVVSVV